MDLIDLMYPIDLMYLMDFVDLMRQQKTCRDTTAISQSQSCANEPIEQRMGPVRPTLEFRVELDTYIEGVLLDLHRLDEAIIRRSTAENQSCLSQGLPVSIIKLVAMPVTFADPCTPVARRYSGPLLKDTLVCPQPEGTAFVDILALSRDEIDDLVGAPLIKLTGTRIRQSRLAAGKLDDRHLHAQAETKVRDPLFSCVSRCQDHAFHAPVSETAGDQNAIHIAKLRLQILRSQSF